jgi:arylsulfatase A-like enzyme
MYSPEDFRMRLPYEAHRNPIPPLRAMREKHLDRSQNTQTQEAFMVDERELKEAIALSCGMITMIDDAVGSIVAALKANGQYDNTVIIFNADHGDYLGDYGLLLKGAVQLNSITQVPFIWSDPATRAGRVSASLASTADLAPTIIERAGLKPYWGIQGGSLLPAIHEGRKTREKLVIEYQDFLPRMGFSKAACVRTFMTDDWRLTHYKGENWGELYDRRNDPDESHNLWDDPGHAKKRGELTDRLVHEMIDLVDQSPRALRRA